MTDITGIPLTGSGLMFSGEEMKDGSIEDAKWKNIHCTAWDGDRHILWVLDRSSLRRVTIYRNEHIMAVLLSVSYLASFPPGIVPIFIEYYMLGGVVDTVCTLSTEPLLDDLYSMGIQRRSGDVFIATNRYYITWYSIANRCYRSIVPNLSNANWCSISSMDANGLFAIATSDSSTSCLWNPTNEIVDSFIGLQPVLESVYNPHLGIFYLLHKVPIDDRFHISFSVYKPDTKSQTIIAPRDNQHIWSCTGALLTSDNSVPFFVMTQDRIYPTQIDDGAIQHSPRYIEWKPPDYSEYNKNGPMDWNGHMVANGECNGRFVVFYITRMATAINYLLPMFDNHKRRRIAV
jgi:hypothetical protein